MTHPGRSDLDVMAPRPPAPKRALPDCLRSKMGYVKKKATSETQLPPLVRKDSEETQVKRSKSKAARKRTGGSKGLGSRGQNRGEQRERPVWNASNVNVADKPREQERPRRASAGVAEQQKSSRRKSRAGKAVKAPPRVAELQPVKAEVCKKGKQMRNRADEIQRELEEELRGLDHNSEQDMMDC
eukprot:TRINITY_DN1336_c0_g1_i4.p1 TRINITY_DN1336_c0_g1~~TRINITY_DN1336_c0_g1_i4.p1  ORF type:complete len:185 (+),score=40.87 TRINITY_DN1336_c0_g1_i4:198-752(+)